ncbi:hypothetical protein LOTGIDRAFT_236481 [Lottia gigantea]|uniref:Peptidase M60 domain-containing protein n=1 Tax=Lottia gigantea TaxID=225164 RepID=V3ZHF7_LOTGI|nr:hypothetical protein LOTGIDRAFT_236481 [Lottia gigantea]ESO83632.1 hypothetical protein LOTGIDRAFT_236481 [Lottia gigantea]
MVDVRDELGEKWREEILKDVSVLPEIGCVPSTLVVLGDESRPILSNPQQKHVWIAVGELGRGRIAVVGHGGYITKINTTSGHTNPEIKHFNDNLKSWLVRSENVDMKEMKNFKNLTPESLKNAKIVICTGESNANVTDKEILEYIQNGGALLHAVCAWGWLQIRNTKNIHDIPLYEVLEEVGIIYTKGYFWLPKSGLHIAISKASESQHVIHALDHTHLDNCCSTLSQINDCPVKVLQSVMKKSGEKVHKIISEKEHECIPSEKRPVSSSIGKSVMFLHDVLAKTGNGYKKMPGIDLFPGDFTEDPPLSDGRIIIESEIPAAHPTGFYVRAGEEVELEIVTEESLNCGWEIQIGCHSDHLQTSNAMKRWPIITEKQKITQKNLKMKTPIGGLMYVWSPKMASKIIINVKNAIESPLFDLTQPETIINWKTNRQAPGLWADLGGHHIVFTLPAKSVGDLEDPTAVLESWDRVVCAHHHLRGTDPNSQRREWIVADVQPSCGYMHSGYPIVTHLDVADPSKSSFLLNNKTLLESGNWGLFHELGHNMQKPTWTFRGTGEVTCNIFTLHAMDVIAQKSPWIHSWLEGKVPKARQFIRSSAGFSKWQSDPGIALFVYAQLYNQFGWSVYKKTFRQYEEQDMPPQLKTEEEKIDYWFETMSKFSEYNLAPLADLWSIPLSDTCREQLKVFPSFLPDDEITQGVPEKVEELEKKYPKLVRKIRPPCDQFEEQILCRRKWSVLVNKSK